MAKHKIIQIALENLETSTGIKGIWENDNSI